MPRLSSVLVAFFFLLRRTFDFFFLFNRNSAVVLLVSYRFSFFFFAFSPGDEQIHSFFFFGWRQHSTRVSRPMAHTLLFLFLCVLVVTRRSLRSYSAVRRSIAFQNLKLRALFKPLYMCDRVVDGLLFSKLRGYWKLIHAAKLRFAAVKNKQTEKKKRKSSEWQGKAVRRAWVFISHHYSGRVACLLVVRVGERGSQGRQRDQASTSSISLSFTSRLPSFIYLDLFIYYFSNSFDYVVL